MKTEIKAIIIENLKLLIPLIITLLFGMLLYYVMNYDTSTPELDKKVEYYNEKINDKIPDWADMSQMYIHYDWDKIQTGEFPRTLF